MNLLPPPSDLTAPNGDLLLSLVQDHAKDEGYAVVTKRSQRDKRGEKDKIWLRCSRGGKIREMTGQKRKHETSRHNDCPFECIMKLDKKENTWRLRIKNASHNHDSEKRVAHVAHRKAALTREIEDTIAEQTANRATPREIIHALHQGLEEDPIWNSRDIYNARDKIRRQNLNPPPST